MDVEDDPLYGRTKGYVACPLRTVLELGLAAVCRPSPISEHSHLGEADLDALIEYFLAMRHLKFDPKPASSPPS